MGEGVSYHDYLIQRGKQYQEKHNEKVKQSKAADTECSFKPKILGKIYKSKKDEEKEGKEGKEGKKKEESAGGNKWEQLYKLHDRKKGRVNRPEDDVEWERHQAECTFQPNKDKKPTRGRKNSPSPIKKDRMGKPVAAIEKKALKGRDRSQPAPMRGGTLKGKQNQGASSPAAFPSSPKAGGSPRLFSAQDEVFEDFEDHK